MKRKVGITETILRDAHQSFMATRMSTPEMVEVAEKLDKIGYHSLEVWGGATFDSSIRYLNEDPWERLRTLRKLIKNTKLQMLLRGRTFSATNPIPTTLWRSSSKKASKTVSISSESSTP